MTEKSNTSQFCFLFFIILGYLLPGNVASAEVYKFEDAKGKIHYTTKAPTKEAKPVELPPIMRGEVKIKPPQLITCEQHGGIDCALGPDSDGSVICRDGYKDASPRFRFSCASPKLEIVQVSDTNAEGLFTVLVRNTKSVAAKGTEVFYKLSDGKELKLEGPASIEPFNGAEYKFTPAKDSAPLPKPAYEDIDVRCGNCGS